MTRDVNRALEQVERALEHILDRSKLPKNETVKTKSPTIRGWRASASDPSQYAEPKARAVFRGKISMTKLSVTARAIKVTVPLDPAAISTLPLPNGERAELTVGCEGQQYVTSISTKSLRKAKNAIGANGAEKIFVMLQGKLKGHEIIECGLVAQVKTTKATKETQGVAK